MSENQSSYRQVVKATSVFGGVQVFNILISLVRSKFIAVLLGPTGTGFMGLLNTPIGFIQNLTGMGIGFSAVRDISEANETGDQKRLSKTLLVFRRWTWFTGLLGMLVVLVLAPFLSKFSFGDNSQTIAFILLSATLLLSSLSGGQSAILRGTRRIKDTAKAGIWGSLLGLITSIPLYYFYGINGIVPSLIIASIVGLLLSWYYSRRVKIVPVTVSYKDTINSGKEMISLGFVMTLSSLIGSAVSYLVILFISYFGGADQVGLYTGGWSITNQYVGLLFAAMGADYYPKLAGIHKDNQKVKEAVNQQAEISILIIAPIMLLYLISLPLLIRLLYTTAYLPILQFAQWVAIGMLFKTASWCMGFIFAAKGDKKMFFNVELIANVLLLALYIGGYYFLHLEGLGVAFTILYIIYCSYVYLICRKKYSFNFTRPFINLFFFFLVVTLVAFLSIYCIKGTMGYLFAVLCFLIATIYSFKELDQRIGIKEFIKNKFKK